MATGQLLPSLQPLPVPWKPTNTIHSTVNISMCMACALGSRLGALGILFHLLSHQSEEADSIIQDPSVGPGSVPSFPIPTPPLPSRTSESSKKVPNIAGAHTTPWACCASAISISGVVTTHLPSQDTAERNIPRDTLPLETWHVVAPAHFSPGMSTSIPPAMTESWEQCQIPIPTWRSADLY